MKKFISLSLAILSVTVLSFALLINAQAATLPASYNANPENPMYVTSIKNQGDFGVCWAFSAIACCESEAIKNHEADPDEIDLSELHLAYFAYNAQKDETDDEIITSIPFYNMGGDLSLSAFTLSKWIGLADESVAKFEDFVNNPTKLPEASLQYGNNEYYIKNAYTFDYESEFPKIKEAIMNFGSVQSAYYSEDSYLNDETSAYYCPSPLTINHAIAIIGWNDNYSKENFNESSRPSSDGAWLVKNSWGEHHGINGYFWLSYEDKSLTSAVAYDVEPAASFDFDNNYQHDGGFSLTHFEYESIKAANIFKSKADEELLAASIFTFDADNTPYTLKIYVNPETLSPSTFSQNSPVHEQSGYITQAGFVTLPLTSSVILSEGDTFIVCIETEATIAFDSYQEIYNGTEVTAISKATAKADQTYVAINGSGFYDASTTENGASPVNARIKAFTKNCTLGEAILKSLPETKSIEYGQSLKSSSLIGGSVIDSLHGTAIRGTWKFKDYTVIPKNGDDIEIIFTPEDPSYQGFSKTIKAVVTPSAPIVELKFEKTSYSKTDPLKLITTVKNKYTDTLTSFGEVSYTYKIEDGEPIAFDGSLLPTKEMEGKRVTVTSTVSAVDGKYLIASKDISFTVPKSNTPDPIPGESDNSSNTESESATQTDTNLDESESIDESLQESINESINEGIAESESIEESIQESLQESVRESVEESVEESVRDEIAKSLSCGSSASIPAIFSICALAVAVVTKKKRH